MKKILLIFITLSLLAAPAPGICAGWTSGFGAEADNYIKKLAAKYSIPEENIDDNFSYSVITYGGNRTDILKIVDLNYGDEVYYKSINDLPRKNNSRPDYSSSQSNSGYSYKPDSSYDNQSDEYEEFRDRIKNAVRSKDPAKIMNVANEMTDDHWWDNYKVKGPGRYAIESTTSYLLWGIKEIPDMYDIYTMLITDLTQRDMEMPLGGESDAFVRYVKNDKNVNVDNAIQFLESIKAKIPDINFDGNSLRRMSESAVAYNIKELNRTFTPHNQKNP